MHIYYYFIIIPSWLDYLFGTYAGSKEEVKQIWGSKPSGEEANDTAVHVASSKQDKVE